LTKVTTFLATVVTLVGDDKVVRCKVVLGESLRIDLAFEDRAHYEAFLDALGRARGGGAKLLGLDNLWFDPDQVRLVYEVDVQGQLVVSREEANGEIFRLDGSGRREVS